MPKRRKEVEDPNKTDKPCPKCGDLLYRRQIHVVHGSCWRCSAAMPVAYGFCGGMALGPPEFVPAEIEAAQAMGAILREQFSQTVQSAYLATHQRRAAPKRCVILDSPSSQNRALF